MKCEFLHYVNFLHCILTSSFKTKNFYKYLIFSADFSRISSICFPFLEWEPSFTSILYCLCILCICIYLFIYQKPKLIFYCVMKAVLIYKLNCVHQSSLHFYHFYHDVYQGHFLSCHLSLSGPSIRGPQPEKTTTMGYKNKTK
jgi:hypothetical protein